MTNLIKFDLKIPYWVTFRIPTAINFLLSFSVPPFTTIYGMILNAMGKEQDDYSYLNKFMIALEVIHFGERIWDTISYMKTADPKSAVVKKSEINKILKGDSDLKQKKVDILVEQYNLTQKEADSLIKEGNAISESDFRGVFYTQALQCERILKPEFRIFLLIEDQTVWEEIYSALKNSARPIYLGQSDDFVIIDKLTTIKNPQKVKLDEVSTIYPGILENSEIINLPLSYEKSGRIINCIKKKFSIFEGKRKLPEEVEGFIVDDSYIYF